MKWGRNKSSPPSLINRVFPVSWFSKFKQKGGSPENSSGKKQQRGKLDFPTRNSMHSSGFREAVFYSVVDDNRDAYWTLSFREDRAGEGRRRASRINPLWLDSDDEFRVQESFGLKEMGFTRGVHRSINDMVNDIEKMKGKQHRENGSFRKKKHKEIKAKTESAKISRRSRSRKTKHMGGKAYAGKSDCRIRVLEDMKRGQKKLKKMERRKQAPNLDSFAVVKTSFDPQKDFRDSMAEMIRYKGIRRPKELEQLLACYLTLNSDGYHDLIIKAFQQVWVELNEGVY